MGSYSIGYDIIKVLGFLGVLLAVALYLVKAVRRSTPGSKGPRLALVETLSLGSNRFICLVRADNAHVLLGVTQSSITFLKEVECEPRKDSLGPKETQWAENQASKTGSDETSKNLEDPKFFSVLCREIRTLKNGWRKRLPFLTLAFSAVAVSLFLLAASSVEAAPSPQDLPLPNVNIQIPGAQNQGGLLTSLGILAMLTVLTLAPSILILTTSFTRIVVVFSFLRAGLGTQQTPPNQVLIGLALLLTFFVMSATWSQVNEVAIKPYMAGEITAQKALELGQEPVKDFMLRQTRDKDLALFASIAGNQNPKSPKDMNLIEIVPAFAISELRTAFEIGFILFLPFLIIDMVVASTLMSMGMLMLPPILISLPFKILLFVLVDGWALLVRTLVGSFR